ncbi:NmrA family transcriptional regulator [Mycolicibacterium novocastrense]|uniref:SDR family oxidoreductase n=1 Tax=Mycolicibacterium novocastrense TaxID=59813 RepID=UPI000749A79B|nr:SDR family oxidoreductase [Mycolicibacterium novocastrense]KUH66269.1 NmrA family transcriptional regulator [Mycolicibacterium novocastrense]KUH71620.1 NmrA family transcriptional regulator [Mycolicibacterium novocastrense]KUH72622.1 NmrA family transcriptional regulator [Mycolicibacterium novocastrense]
MKIVVIGGTGLIGSKLVQILDRQGHDTVAAAPSTGVNTFTGEGLRDALEGAAVVVDVSNSPQLDDSARKFFQTATTNLLDAEQAAGVGHHVALSVVGTDEMAPQSGYFQAKLDQERLISDGPIPFTIVHATQFFEFLQTLADSATEGDTVRMPPVYFQPMAAADVAEGLAIAAVNEPVNRIVEIGGPVEFLLPDLIRTALTARGDTRQVVADPSAKYWGIDLAERTLVPGEGATLFGTRFEDWILEAAATA